MNNTTNVKDIKDIQVIIETDAKTKVPKGKINIHVVVDKKSYEEMIKMKGDRTWGDFLIDKLIKKR